MKCIIIDDENFSREALSVLILKSPHVVLVNEFDNAIDAIKYLNEDNDIDLLFLDIHMPNFSGFDLVKTLKNLPQIILITSDKNLAMEAFKYDCIIDYLLKPVLSERFEKAIQKAKFNSGRKINATLPESFTNKDFYINIGKRLIKIEVLTIHYIQVKGDYVVIKTDDQRYIVHITLKKIEQKLPAEIFLRTHRSFVVNRMKIIDIKDSTVLIGKDIIPVSKNYRSNLFHTIDII